MKGKTIMKKERIIAIIVAIIVAIAVIAFLVFSKNGQNTNENNANSTSNNLKTTQQSKGNYNVFEAIKLIKTDDTYEKINELIGFEGELTGQSKEGSVLNYKKYKWELTEDTYIEATIDDNKGKITTSATANFPDSMIKNDKVDLSRTDEMKKKINAEGGLTYEEVVEFVGGVEGTLDSVDSFSHKYIWVNSKGGTLHATFNNSGKCTIFNGVF